MKKIIIVATLVLVLIGAVPYVTGLVMERSVHNAVKQVNSLSGQGAADYSIEIMRYDRGYRTTDIDWKIKVADPGAAGAMQEIILSEHARHGFTSVVSTTDFEKDEDFKKFIDEDLEGKNPFHLTTVYSITGAIESTFAMEGFDLQSEGKSVTVKPGGWVINTDQGLSRFKCSGNWEGMDSSEDTLQALKVDMEFARLTTHLWDGYLDLSIDQFKGVGKKGEVAALTDLKCKYRLADVDRQKNVLSAEVVVSLDKLTVSKKEVNGANLKLGVYNMSIPGYEAFMKAYMESMPKMLTSAAGSAGTQPPGDRISAQKVEFQQKMMAAYEKLLTKDIELRISDLLLKMPEGDVAGNVTLRLLQNMSVMQFLPVVSQPDLILGILHLQSDMRVPKKLVGPAPRLISPIYPGMPTGIFIEDGDYLVHQAQTKDGKLFLNEKEFNLKN